MTSATAPRMNIRMGFPTKRGRLRHPGALLGLRLGAASECDGGHSETVKTVVTFC
jgi:hypothetical protein